MPFLRASAAALGAVSLGGGVLALFKTSNGAGSLFLLTVGTVLVLLAVASDRMELESFELLGAKVKVREIVTRLLELAEHGSGSALPEQQTMMRRQALTLQRLASLHELYDHVRRMEPPSDRRTATLDQLAAHMQRAAQDVEFDPAEVSVWFQEGSDALRVVALNVMLARPECRDFTAVMKAVDEPRSLFEQFYALLLALTMVQDLDQLERELLAQALDRAAGRRRFRRDAPLMDLHESILAALAS